MFVFRLTAGAALAALAPIAALTAQTRELPRTLAPRPTEAAITAADLMTRLYIVADDSMGGRASGSPGHVKATNYIAAEAQRLGLRPAGPDGSWFQDLPMMRRGFAPAGVVVVGDKSFKLGEQFGVMIARGATSRSVPAATLVIGGTHGDSATWITAEEARGKVVVMRSNGRSLSMGTRGLAIGATSRFAGAAAYVVPVWDALPPLFRRELSQFALGMRASGSVRDVPPTLVASDEMVEALAARAGTEITFDLQYIESPVTARNVLAVLPGSDPRLAGQYVAIGAHNDALSELTEGVDHDSLRAMNGLRAQLERSLPARQRPSPQQTAKLWVNTDSLRALRPARSDRIVNGADDDGSGTVALLELAEAFAASPQRPKRSILFVWHAGEELGLLGASHFTDNPTVPLDSVVAQLNMDMVGRGGVDDVVGGGPRYVQLVGSRRLSRELGDLVEAVNARRTTPFVFDYSLDADGHPERIYCRSDHAMYARYGVPVTFFTTGLHRDYHQVTDEPQYILYDKLADLTTFVRDVTWELTERAARLKVDGGKTDPKAPCRQ